MVLILTLILFSFSLFGKVTCPDNQLQIVFSHRDLSGPIMPKGRPRKRPQESEDGEALATLDQNAAEDQIGKSGKVKDTVSGPKSVKAKKKVDEENDTSEEPLEKKSKVGSIHRSVAKITIEHCTS